jgi:hypothetical protein
MRQLSVPRVASSALSYAASLAEFYAPRAYSMQFCVQKPEKGPLFYPAHNLANLCRHIRSTPEMRVKIPPEEILSTNFLSSSL